MDERQPQTSGDNQLQQELDHLRAEVARLQDEVDHLDRLAHEDALVPLPNRRGFMRQLEKIIDRVRRYGDTAALLFIDIDGLKFINDSFGHPAGDEALVRVSDLLLGGVRSSDCVARLGGDEFAILLEHSNEEEARETAARLESQVAEAEFRHGDAALPLSIAIGVAAIGATDKVEEVIARADAEMYRAKSA